MDGEQSVGSLAGEFDGDPESDANRYAESQPERDTVQDIAEWNAKSDADQYADHNTLCRAGAAHFSCGGCWPSGRE
jgi:hypothetical protein